METLNKFLLTLTLLTLTALLYSCSDSPSSSEPSEVPEIEITDLSSGQLLSGEIELNINRSSPSHFKEIKLYLRDEEIQSIEPNTSRIELTTWDFANGQAELKVEGITTDDESITSTYNVEFENYVFQWETDGRIDFYTNHQWMLRADLLISDEKGNVIGDFDLFNYRDGLLQFLAPEDINFEWPESIAVTRVYYYKITYDRWPDYNYTFANTSANLTPGSLIDQNNFNAKANTNTAYSSFEFKNDLKLEEHFDIIQQSTSGEDVNFEMTNIDAEENLSIRIFRPGGTSYRLWYYVNSTDNISSDFSHEKDENWIIYSYSEDIKSNVTPRYWIVEEISDTVSINYQKNYSTPSIKEVDAPSGFEDISTNARVILDNEIFETPSVNSENKSFLYYPAESDFDMSSYRMTETQYGVTHTNTIYDVLFDEIDDVLNVNFNIDEVTSSKITTTQSGDHNIYRLSGNYSDDYNYNYMNIWSSKNEATVILPNIDRYIDSRHSDFYTSRFELNSYFFRGFEKFNEDQPYLNYQFINRARINHKTKSY